MNIDLSGVHSGGGSEVIEVNELGNEDMHPMILSHINNDVRSNLDRLSILRIRNATSELRQSHIDLTDYV